ncbi:MAG: PAS domain-containing protein [Candidatus Terrybacteria bacterium]|nr:PAS domain-containing protein [Candidatus Terrybacteria bacterium]
MDNFLENEQKYREIIGDIIENTSLCIKVFDEKMNLIFINKGGREEHFIKDDEDIRKWNWLKTVKEQYQMEVVEKFQRAFLRGESSVAEFEHTPEGSSHKWCLGLLSPIKDKEGKVKSVLFLSIDISNSPR